MHAVGGRQFLQDCSHCRAADALAPMPACEFVGYECRGLAQDRRLDVARKTTRRQAYDPVEPTFGTVGRAPGFELSVPALQPLERWRRPVLELVDGGVAEHLEHFRGVAGHLGFQTEVPCAQRVHGRRILEAVMPAVRAGTCPRVSAVPYP